MKSRSTQQGRSSTAGADRAQLVAGDGARQDGRFGNESDVSRLTGIARRTLQKHRLLRIGLPFYKLGGRVLYDLTEVEAVVRGGRVETIQT
jgi:hypothetical protein